jgi:DNA end-binding protein Ku
MPRSIWTGSISFGLVNIPVKLYSAIHEHDVHFHQLAPDGSRIHYERVSEKTGKAVDYDDIRRGFETSKGHYVLFEKGELEDLQPASTKTVDIEDFVGLAEIDPVYYERTYLLAPDGDGAAKGYALLASVMEDTQRVAIGKVVMREKQYLAAIRPYGKGLALSTMRFADEVAAPKDVDVFPTRKASVNPREKKMSKQIVYAMPSEWNPARYHDDYEEQLRDIIKAKAKGKTIEVEQPEESAQVIDLMDALRASLEGKSSRSSRARRPAKKTRAEKTTRAAKKKPAKATHRRARKSA